MAVLENLEIFYGMDFLKAGYIYLVKSNYESIPKNIQALCISELIEAYLKEKKCNSQPIAIKKSFENIRSYRRFDSNDLKISIGISTIMYKALLAPRRMRIAPILKRPMSIKRHRRTVNMVVFI